MKMRPVLFLFLTSLVFLLLAFLTHFKSKNTRKSQHNDAFLMDIRDISTETETITLPTIFIITPTYYRLAQLADMTRMANTLKNVEEIHWIVIEDGNKTRGAIFDLLVRSDISFTYLHAATPANISKRLRGLHQRNLGLLWIRKHVNHKITKGVVYFADDDNAYDLRIFEEMRKTKKVSVWPVGFVSERKYQLPVVENGKVVNFESWNTVYRRFPVDMAAFALNLRVLFDYPDLDFRRSFLAGYQETQFLALCCKLYELEPLASNLTQVLVWHTRTEKPRIAFPNKKYLDV